MDRIAQALVASVAFLELSDDDTVDPDSALTTLETVGAILQDASPSELLAISNAAAVECKLQKESGADEDTIEFYSNFLENFGLD